MFHGVIAHPIIHFISLRHCCVLVAVKPKQAAVRFIWQLSVSLANGHTVRAAGVASRHGPVFVFSAPFITNGAARAAGAFVHSFPDAG